MVAMSAEATSPLRPRSAEVRSGTASSPGHCRDINEDAHANAGRWCVVADGMGGHGGGETASMLAIDAFRSAAEIRTLADLHTVIGTAHDTIRCRAGADPDLSGMGTTLVGVVLLADPAGAIMGRPSDPVAVVFNVGDSRCYRLVDGELSLVSVDHSHVQELVDAGRLTAEQAQAHPMRHVITRALGTDDPVQADVFVLDARRCRLLLCTDGLTEELAPRTIGRVLAGISDPGTAAARLVELALRGEARDNITAVVVDIGDESDVGFVPAAQSATVSP